MKIINLEYGMPTVEQAVNRLKGEITTAKMQGINAAKIIHGYGSSGKGGAIKREVQNQLCAMKSKGVIKDFIKGEDISPFSENYRRINTQYPSLSKDRDYLNGNEGISIVIFK